MPRAFASGGSPPRLASTRGDDCALRSARESFADDVIVRMLAIFQIYRFCEDILQGALWQVSSGVCIDCADGADTFWHICAELCRYLTAWLRREVSGVSRRLGALGASRGVGASGHGSARFRASRGAPGRLRASRWDSVRCLAFQCVSLRLRVSVRLYVKD